MTLTPSNRILRSICVVFRKTRLKNVSINGTTADTSAELQKESILNGIKYLYLQATKIIFY